MAETSVVIASLKSQGRLEKKNPNFQNKKREKGALVGGLVWILSHELS
jgi:hypothetical protein